MCLCWTDIGSPCFLYYRNTVWAVEMAHLVKCLSGRHETTSSIPREIAELGRPGQIALWGQLVSQPG